jgi:2'-hydroxyisoflavone reductase
MTTRRDVIQAGIYAAASAALFPTQALSAKPGSLLILGGTGFIGPHLTQEALRLGWKVTHFNRGKSSPAGVTGVETLIGDRKGQLDALRGRQWDVVIDDTGYVPKYVKLSGDLLAPNIGYYLYISSISAYASFAKPNDEDSPTGVLSDPQAEQITGETYGPMKALCERYTLETFKGRACIVRPGYIVGPLDPTDRFTYWPVRVAKGGEMLAPGTAHDPIQIIDVRDLAAWMMRLAQARTVGKFNAVSPARAFTMGALIEESQRASPASKTTITWVPESFLSKHWKADEVDLPPWAPISGDTAGLSLISASLAQRTGLKSRPLRDTVRDTLEWFHSLPPERQSKLHAGLDAQKESETLRLWHASGGVS